MKHDTTGMRRGGAATRRARAIFAFLAAALAPAPASAAIDCSANGGCKACEKLICGEPSRSSTTYAGRTQTTKTYYTCNDGTERTIDVFCSAACVTNNNLPPGSPVSYAVGNALSGCNPGQNAIAIGGNSACPANHFEIPACAKPAGTHSDEKGTFSYTCM
ncbi:MAG: hypothetical protein LBT45_00465 [Rickettsiales bacterium]|nr:hypothetical protein [Rickettsiales bacterium]